ncbi:MAG: LytTR family transcriptional regulator DNA-binding domain-containing protein [Chitinophagaceae bacterium]|nr:LytTR family transcriptional regulator DNA-binding domain-containing protein [Chitinophagaceae bacterium]
MYRGGQKHLCTPNLKDLVTHLPARQFVRVHKSFIIPVNRITGIEGNRIPLKNVNAEILIGESYKEELMESLSTG